MLVEGYTEETFVRDVLYHLLVPAGIFVTPRMPPTSATGRGGGRSFASWLRTTRDWLLRDQRAYLTTMFDVYGLPSDFPRLVESRAISDIYKRAEFLEGQFREVVAGATHNVQQRFIPYLQMHEFEALVFSNLKELEDLERDWVGRADACSHEAKGFPTPEHVNDSIVTAPSKRLEKHFHSPAYRKLLHGVLAVQSIGLTHIRSRCRRFDAWLNNLSSLPPIA